MPRLAVFAAGDGVGDGEHRAAALVAVALELAAAVDSPAAANVGNGEDTAQVLAKNEARDAKARRHGDVEATVGVEQRGVVAVELDVWREREETVVCWRVQQRAPPLRSPSLPLGRTFRVDEEHGDARAVLAVVKDLLGLELARVKALDLRLVVELRLLQGTPVNGGAVGQWLGKRGRKAKRPHVARPTPFANRTYHALFRVERGAEDGAGVKKGGKAEEDLWVVVVAGERRDGAHRQRQVAQVVAAHVVHLGGGGG